MARQATGARIIRPSRRVVVQACALAVLVCSVTVLAAAAPWMDSAPHPEPAHSSGTAATGQGAPAPAVEAPMTRTAIPIDGNAMLIERAAARQWPGTGSADDPIIIEGLVLDTHERSGLRLAGTTHHVRIVDAELQISGRGDGIHLDRVTNVSIEGLVSSGGTTGIRVVGSQDVTVRDSAIDGARFGVLIQSSSDIRVTGLRLAFNHVAVHAPDSAEAPAQRIRIDGNNILANRGDTPARGGGIVVAGTDHVVEHNVLDANGNVGIWIESNHTLVQHNRLDSGTGNGIVVDGAKDATVRKNSVTAHAGDGISAFGTRNLRVDDNEVQDQATTAVRLHDDYGTQATNNKIARSGFCLVSINSVSIVVAHNALEHCVQGIDLAASGPGAVQENRLERMLDSGISLFGATGVLVEGNLVTGAALHGIFLGNRSLAVELNENMVLSSAHGITITDSSSQIRSTRDGVFGPGSVGFLIQSASDVTVRNPVAQRLDEGLHVGSAPRVSIVGGLVSHNVIGISVASALDPVAISGTQASANGVGVQATGAAPHQLERLDIKENTQGVLLVDTNAVTLAHSWVRDNRIGIHFVNASNGLVYDNVVVNDALPGDQDHLIQNSRGNLWNVTRTSGPSLVGGPFIGGNYWRDYQAPDADRDGLGDVPYWPVPVHLPEDNVLGIEASVEGPLDMHPLVSDEDPERNAPGAGGADQPDDDDGSDDDDARPAGEPGPGSKLPLAGPSLDGAGALR